MYVLGRFNEGYALFHIGAAGFIGKAFLSHLYRKYENFKFVLVDKLGVKSKLEIPDETAASCRALFVKAALQGTLQFWSQT